MDPHNRRQIRIIPTEKSDPSRLRRRQLVDEAVAQLTPDEQFALASLLEKLNTYLAQGEPHA